MTSWGFSFHAALLTVRNAVAVGVERGVVVLWGRSKGARLLRVICVLALNDRGARLQLPVESK